jgi:hypothetical protein
MPAGECADAAKNQGAEGNDTDGRITEVNLGSAIASAPTFCR